MRVVLDTSVLVAAIRSSAGASNRLLQMALNREFELLLSVALILEYESVVMRTEHILASGLYVPEINDLLDTLIESAIPIHLGFFWPTSAQDEDDTHVLTLAVQGRADVLVTHNIRDFQSVATHLGIHLETPAAALRRLRG